MSFQRMKRYAKGRKKAQAAFFIPAKDESEANLLIGTVHFAIF